jgi:hypothetical protein
MLTSRSFRSEEKEYLKIYSDQHIPLRKRILLEIIFPESSPLRCLGDVVWVKKLPKSSKARYDIGISSLAIPEGKQDSLSDYLIEENNPL